MATRSHWLYSFIRFLPALSLCAVSVAGCDPGNTAAAVDERSSATSTDPGVAVVELFTSEGCSSCPPAEQVLGDISEAQLRDGRPIFTLAFHVDYWNHLGWADPFSTAAYSQRQTDYNQALGRNDVYTPQMIVNGSKEFVGSDRATADKAIDAALAQPAVAKISLQLFEKEKGGQTLAKYTITGADAQDRVNIAVVESGLTSEVKQGENAGRTLKDPSVVRWFDTGVMTTNGVFEKPLPALHQVNMKLAKVVVYVQRKTDGAVIGAAAVPFP